jgi:hypothetical protein
VPPRRLARSARSWAEPVARFGFAAKGAVYATVGILSARAALGWRSRPADPRGAIRTVGDQPFGVALAALIALGLASYALWRLGQALLDLDKKGSGWRGLAVRLGFLTSAIVYLGFAATAVDIALGRAGHSTSLRGWTAWLLASPAGEWVVGLFGLGVIGTGLYQFYKAYVLRFDDHLHRTRMNAQQKRWAARLGRFGLSARGVTFLLVGWFLVQAALRSDPRQARGIVQALMLLKQQGEGPWLLGIVALGLFAYGVHSLMAARYERLRA